MNHSALACSVLDGSEESERIFILDTEASSGRPLLKYAVHQLVARYGEVEVFLHDIGAQQWVRGLSPDICSRLAIHDGVQELIQDSGAGLTVFPAAKRAVVVDSLSFLLLRHSPATICHWLTANNHTHTLCLVHSDLHEERVLLQLDYVATSNLVVQTSSSRGTGGEYVGNVCTVHRRPSGKIIRKVEQYFLSDDCASLTTSDCAVAKLKPQPQVDPAANLTFDLHLSAQEREARSRVILPYTSAQEEGLVGVTSHKSSGKIFYEPDEEDCFGDSDPDDDLDI